MALAAAIVWEFRTSGNNDNGGGFKTGASGTDYSQQDAAVLTLTDLAMVTGGTTLTSATGGFTAAMIGNVIYIKSGTNFTAGWYEITARADTNTVTIDRDATNGSNASSGTGSVGGARALPTDAFFEALTAGNTVYIKAGTYTLTEAINLAKDGTNALPISVIGYNSSRTDNPTGSDRPLFICGAYAIHFNDYWHLFNSIWVGSASPFFQVKDYCLTFNCKFFNNSSSAGRVALDFQYYNNRSIDCELIATNGSAVQVYRGIGSLLFCLFHNSTTGILNNADNTNIIFCNIIQNTTGINTASKPALVILNNTINGNTTGISGGTGLYNNIINNIITNNTTGASWTSEYKSNFWDYNNWHGNSTDVTNVTKGANDTANDPEFEFVGVQGTDDSGVNNKTTYTVDTSENFITLGVSVGNTILNKTDGSWGTITSISTTTNPNDTVNFSGGLTGGTDNDFDNGDTYAILGNFSLQSTSDCIGAGFGIRLGVGA